MGDGADEPTRPIFAIFEGGGAKGIAHVGALQAVQDNRLEIVGVAGTSAGALVATLVAIGLEADDIMGIFARYGTSPVALLGAGDWRRLQRVLLHGKRALITGGIVGPIANVLLAPRVMTTLAIATLRRGHFSVDRIADFVNRVVRDRLLEIRQRSGLVQDIPDRITFRVLGAGWPTVVPLRVVVTDVDRGSLELFDAASTPDVVVAEAVAASIAIPLIFRPALIPSFRPGRFADGGLVSNLPVWTVAEDKLAYEREHPNGKPVPIVGFGFDAAKDVTIDDTLLAFLGKLGSAALLGSQGATTRFLDDVTIVPLDTTLTLLEFDQGRPAYDAAREAGRVSADRGLRFALAIQPDGIRRELSTIRDELLGRIDRRRQAVGQEKVEQMRVTLVTPFGQRSLRVIASVHMAGDTDDRLLLDRRGHDAATAFREQGMRVFERAPDTDPPIPRFMTRYEHALVRRSVRTVVCVPIFADPDAWSLDEQARPTPAGILSVDSDLPLGDLFQEHDIQDLLVTRSAELYGVLSLGEE